MPPSRKWLRHKLIWRASLVVLAVFTAGLIGLYFYLSPRINKGLTAYVLFHPPISSNLVQSIEIAGSVGKRYKVLPADSGRQGSKPVVLDSILFTARAEKGVILYTQGVGGSINAQEYRFKIATLLGCGYSVFLYDPEGYGLS